jgi:hypothetical protein
MIQGRLWNLAALMPRLISCRRFVLRLCVTYLAEQLAGVFFCAQRSAPGFPACCDGHEWRARPSRSVSVAAGQVAIATIPPSG